MAFTRKQKKGEYSNENKGVLFINDKEGNDKRPDRRGQLIIKADDYKPDKDGNVLIYLAAWANEHESYGEILSLKASPPQS